MGVCRGERRAGVARVEGTICAAVGAAPIVWWEGGGAVVVVRAAEEGIVACAE